jgi:phosphotransferase system enzyme I (PtsI)
MKGIGVSPGIAIGRAWVLRAKVPRAIVPAGGLRAEGSSSAEGLAPMDGGLAVAGDLPDNSVFADDGVLPDDAGAITREIDLYRGAVEQAAVSLERLMEQAGDAADILGVQLELLYDPLWESEVIDRIRRRSAARDAVLAATERVMQQFLEMEDAYMRERAADIRDMGNRLLAVLDGEVPDGAALDVSPGEGKWVVVAEELTPGDTIGLGNGIVGFVTQIGGATSHAAIIARLRGLPAVTGVSLGSVVDGAGGLSGSIKDGDLLVVDGETGIVLVNPEANELVDYHVKQEAFAERRRLLSTLKDREAVTLDGVRIELLANIGSAADIDVSLAQGAQGVGLLRTELLFMDRETLPTEEEQFQFYKHVLLRAGGRLVTIRTLDIGGDKPLPYLGLTPEANPFLGYRAIRICLDRPVLFLTQLRAILRASIFGKCRIMFPMIGGVEELRRARGFVAVAQEDIRAAGQSFDATVPVGVMIEIPSAALTADLLAQEADFFSIGTNDLTQYVLAVDRMNEQIAAMYDPYHPAVLRLIQEVIGQGHKHGIPVGMCGELAGDPRATELLLKMGLREFSMSAGSIPLVKEIILRSRVFGPGTLPEVEL